MTILEDQKISQAKRYNDLLQEAEAERLKGHDRLACHCEDQAARIESRFKSDPNYAEDWEQYIKIRQ